MTSAPARRRSDEPPRQTTTTDHHDRTDGAMATITPERDELIFGWVTSEALRESTGRGWDEWLVILDAAGAEHSDYEDIVAYIAREHAYVSWAWRQAITLGYVDARHERSRV